MSAPNRIVIDPAIYHGKPVIRGTRVPVTVVVGSLAGGMMFENVQREYDVTPTTSGLPSDLWVNWLNRGRFTRCQQPSSACAS